MVTGISHIAGLTSRRSLRTVLLAGAAAGLPALAGTAHAQEVTIDDERTTPVETATIDSNAPADVVVTEDGSIVLDSGTAITVNSDNNVDMQGGIEIGHVDNATGILLVPGNSGDLTLGGTILLDRTEAQQDENDDENVTDYADNRRGVLLDAGGTFTGDIATGDTSRIDVYGDDSVALDIAGTLDGNLDLEGDLVAVGENAIGLAIRDTVTGDVITTLDNGNAVIGDGAIGFLVSGTVEGAFVFGGNLNVSGYLDTTVDPEDAEDENNEEMAALQATSGIDVSGTINGGFLINGAVPTDFRDEEYVAPSTASVLMEGGGPAIWIRDGATLGAVDTSDLDGYGTFGFINRGEIISRGIYEGVDTTAVLIGNAAIEGGIRNDETFAATSFNANATTFVLGNGASIDAFVNSGTISAAVNSNNTDAFEAVAVLIDAGANLPVMTNNFRIQSSATGDNVDAVVIRDESGTVSEFTNTGALLTAVADYLDEEDTLPTGESIAIDFSANTTGVTIHNTVRDTFDPEEQDRGAYGVVDGDVLLGSGDDIYRADAGFTQGTITFGDGNDIGDFSQDTFLTGHALFGAGDDQLSLDDARMIGRADFGTGSDVFVLTNGAFYSGDIIDEDGLLDVSVTGGSTLYETGVDDTFLSNLTIGSASSLGIGIDENGADATTFIVSDTALLEDGATIQPVFLGGAIETVTANIIMAGTLDVDPTQLVIGDAEGNVPYLFDISFGTNNEGGTNNLQLNVRRRTAEELGIQEGLAPAYDPTLNALGTDDVLGPLVLNITDGDVFIDALEQLLAGPLEAPLAFARAQNNSVTSIITQRLDLARNSGSYPRTFWIQEENYFLNRDSDEVSNGYDGGGFSLAAGVDTGLDQFIDAVGLSVSISSAKYDEKRGGDYPFSRLTYGFGGYGAFSAGPVKFDLRGEYAITDSESERNISIQGVNRNAVGEWEGSQVAGSARVLFEGEVMGITTEPFVSADYVQINEDAYEETGGGDGVNLAVADRTFESLRTNVGIRVGKRFELRPSVYDTGIPGTIHPQFTLAWSQEMMTDPLEADYSYVSTGEDFTLFAQPEDSAFIIGTDVAYENEYAKVHVGVSGTIGETSEAFILRAGVGLKW